MITIIQTDSINRFDVALEESFATTPFVEGYVEKGMDGLWYAFRCGGFDAVEVGTPGVNPVEVGKAVINDYNNRCAGMVERAITRMEKSIAEMSEGPLRKARIRHRDGMVDMLNTGDF